MEELIERLESKKQEIRYLNRWLDKVGSCNDIEEGIRILQTEKREIEREIIAKKRPQKIRSLGL